jgi:SAM-dependent methyltransferase
VNAPPSWKSKYGLTTGYRNRKKAEYFDDTINKDEWQKEVYIEASKLMQSAKLRKVYDIGCGSGYKLVHFLQEYDTVGFDLEATLTYLRKTYADRAWQSVSFDDRTIPPADLVVCADVIEHVEDPDALLDFLSHITGQYLVISTPERDLVYPQGHRCLRGPPANRSHIREWSFTEFGKYVASKFDIVQHRVTNVQQATQMVVCRNLPRDYTKSR